MVLDEYKLAALLDTGARPSVIDHNTLLELKLQQEIAKEPGKLLGLCDTPIEVLGNIDVKVQVGLRPGIRQRIQVLDSNNPTFILRLTFMGQIREVAFDFERNRCKLGKEWEPVQATVSGSSSMTRVLAVWDEASVAHKRALRMELIEKQTDTKRNSGFAHCLEVDRSEPIRARPRRIPLPGNKKS